MFRYLFVYKLEEQIVKRGQLNKKGVKSRESVFRVGEARWDRSFSLQLCSPNLNSIFLFVMLTVKTKDYNEYKFKKKLTTTIIDDSFIFSKYPKFIIKHQSCLCTIVRLSDNYFFPFPQVLQKYDIVKENKYTTVKIILVIKRMPKIIDTWKFASI